ncbi:8859_t:CDS:2 [Paraglomus brasilianum]|uniref:8859_t:CDS:1 n=1 Tax=Paraglomus brasilianum TaxID=144538 RepID=A0A9N9GT95_9GLOM|nr:8859_t:CDS:2 [Paraglomus brasilianum]
MINKSAIVALLMTVALVIITTVAAVPAYQTSCPALSVTNFGITYPSGGEKFKSGSNQKVIVDAKTSNISDIIAVDLFFANGTYYSTLRTGIVPIADRTATIMVTLPQIIDGIFYYQIWGRGPMGLSCFKTGIVFSIE